MLTSQFRRAAPFTAACAPPCRRQLVVRASVAATPVTIPCKAADGTDKGNKEVALKVARDDSAKGLVHRYLVLVQQNERRGTAATKTRMMVRGGGKKPYAQKGTGNARRGSSRSPLFPGGGVTFGPQPRDWTIKMNKKERRLALATAFQSAAEDMIVVESLQNEVPDKKTKSLLKVLSGLGADAVAQKVLIIVKEPLEHIALAGRNVEKLAINRCDAISIFDLLNASKVVIESAALEFVQSFYGAAAAAAEEAAEEEEAAAAAAPAAA